MIKQTSSAEKVWRDACGGLVIRAEVKAPPGRAGYEKQFWPGVEVGLVGWERAHSQGQITGHESAHGIRYAPQEVNQHFQRLGIERFVRDFFSGKPHDVQLMMTTTTYTHPGTLRLKEIQYSLDAVRGGLTKTLFEASIEIENKKTAPQVWINARERTPFVDWPKIIR